MAGFCKDVYDCTVSDTVERPKKGFENGAGATIRTKMEEHRLKCDCDLLTQLQSIDAGIISLDSTKTRAQQTLQFQATVGKLKAELREAEDNLVKALAIKTRKEAKRIEIADLRSATNTRVEELRGAVEDQGARKHEYSVLISQQADGAAFVHLNDAEELLIELNKSNGLFKFVRTMREKFLEAVARGLTSQDQDTSTVSMLPLISCISTSSRDESSPQKVEPQPDEYKRNSRKLARGKRDRSDVLSPVSASSFRRSPRFKVKKL